MKVGMVISAAGMSTRHPPNKLLIMLNNKPVIIKTVSIYVDLPVDLYVVVGHQNTAIKAALSTNFDDGIGIIDNPDYRSGMSTSLRAAIRRMDADYDYFGFSNGDMPFISSDTVSYLLEELFKKKPLILAPSYKNRVGHPVFFRSDLKNELSAITGDQGGREIINRHRSEMVVIPVKDEGTITDMDYYLDTQYAC